MAIDTLKAMREQTEEANKRFMLASREDQLRVSAMARTLRERPVRASEFFALSQETRKAMVEYLPGFAPGRLNTAIEKRDKELTDLDGEKGRLVSAIAEIRGGLEALGKDILLGTGNGAALDATPKDPGTNLQDKITTRDNSPVVSVAIGNVKVEVGQQVERIISGYVDRNLSAMEERLSRLIVRPVMPTGQGVTE
ncbi:MAG: hypothetical protein WCJ66_18930 [Verrucomicrobiota bacterium]